MFCVYIRFRLKLWRLQSINQRSLGDCDQAVPSILDTEHLLETNYELSTWNSFVSFSSGPRGQGVLRQRDLDLKIWDWGRHTSMTRCQHAVTVSLNLIRSSYTWFFGVFSSLLICCLKWSDSGWRWSGHDVSRIWWIVERRFKDKLEDMSVMLSPGGVIINWTEDDMKRDNNYTNIN